MCTSSQDLRFCHRRGCATMRTIKVPRPDSDVASSHCKSITIYELRVAAPRAFHSFQCRRQSPLASGPQKGRPCWRRPSKSCRTRQSPAGCAECSDRSGVSGNSVLIWLSSKPPLFLAVLCTCAPLPPQPAHPPTSGVMPAKGSTVPQGTRMLLPASTRRAPSCRATSRSRFFSSTACVGEAAAAAAAEVSHQKRVDSVFFECRQCRSR